MPDTDKQAVPVYGDILSLSEQIRNGERSPVELVTACQARIEALQPKLNAFITLMTQAALEAARAAEAEIRSGQWRGPLHGIPVAIKDFYDTAGVRTTAAFAHFKERVPRTDAVAVAKLESAGAIILGKTNMHTLGMGTTGLESAFGPVINPWSTRHIPGGSSSGSAAAVAAGLCYATLDTDAIGSCRLPAACCGIVGFKGSYGLISEEGILAGEQPPGEEILWLGHAGIMTRSVRDTAIVLDVLADPAVTKPGASYTTGLGTHRPLRLGIANNARPPKALARLYDEAAETLRNLGHAVVEIPAPLVDPGRGIANIEADRKAVRNTAFSDLDVILLPTIPGETPTVASCGSNPLALSPAYTMFANYYGLPAMTVPCGYDESGLPIGLQFIGAPREDRTVLQLACEYETSCSFFKRVPTPS
jgi:aspartyl-tRNA(Asn)/glutamyl-tRNA(Gln) amidotransferase subunit A